MSDDGPDEEHDDEVVRRAIGGDTAARVVIGDRAVAGGSIEVLVMAALLGHGEEHLDTAEATATSRSDRQVVAIARCVLTGDPERVDALARDHLVDHPDSLIVAWMAAGASRPRGGGGS